MTTLSPSILSADFSHLGADCRMVLDAGAQMLHYAGLYVCSGRFRFSRRYRELSPYLTARSHAWKVSRKIRFLIGSHRSSL